MRWPERCVSLRDKLVQRLQVLIDQHYQEHRPLAFYARALGVTSDHLSRTCRAETRESAMYQLHARLMLEARRLLAHTPMTVGDIAHALGHEDPAYASKFLRARSATRFRLPRVHPQ